MELIKATYDSQIEELKNIQKKEYHFFIENLYNELKYKENINTYEEIQEIIKVVINKFKEYSTKNKTKISSALDNIINSFKDKLKIDAKDDIECSTSNSPNNQNNIEDKSMLFTNVIIFKIIKLFK